MSFNCNALVFPTICVFIPLSYRNKETGFGPVADAAKDPLSFDVATAVVLRFGKLRLESK